MEWKREATTGFLSLGEGMRTRRGGSSRSKGQRIK